MKSRAQVTRNFIIGIILFVLCIAVIWGFGFLEEKGYGDNFWFPIIGVSSAVLFAISSIIVLYNILGDSITYGIEDKEKKYSEMEFAILDDMTLNRINDKFMSFKFRETAEGYLKRKVFTISKDSIYYLVKCVSSINLDETIENEFKLIDDLRKKSQSLCLFLFIYMEQTSEAEIEKVREVEKYLIIDETIFPYKSYCTSIIVLIDKMTNQGRYLDMQSKTSLSIYAHGCRLLKKFFM